MLSAVLPSKSTALYSLRLTAHELTLESSLSTYPLILEPMYFTYLRTYSLGLAAYRLVPGLVSCVKMTHSTTLLDTTFQARGMSSDCYEHHL